ncbi:hypothetical protein [Paraclostridium sordellii]
MSKITISKNRDLDVTMDLLIELSGISKSELTVLVEKCVELGIISYK